jgi:hypothetical protein
MPQAEQVNRCYNSRKRESCSYRMLLHSPNGMLQQVERASFGGKRKEQKENQ